MRLTGKPVLCNYYITYRCNASCSFCDIWEKPSPYSTLENVEKNLIDLKKLGVKVIDFTGGEPLLHREIELLLKKAKELGFVTTLTTNGLLYPKKAVKIHKLVDMLHFSLDYADAEKHDSSRGTACFSKVIESIEVALSLGERPDILFTAFNNNIDEIEKVYTEVVVPNNLILILNPSFSYNGIGEELTETSLVTLQSWG
ncbi:MAG: radical SAM protein, partial [Cyclobacteriaceae bacterium]|nr:radical SAM protein [Cyclobacteriaceae bacterium]